MRLGDMRNFLTGLILLCCLLPVAAGGMRISSALVPETAQLKNFDNEPLWSFDVRRVNLSQQTYERLPPLIAPDAYPTVPDTAVAKKPNNNPGQISDSSDQISASFLTQEWCRKKYRSYSAIDNTFQPYGGGPRRTCLVPPHLQPDGVQPDTLAGDIDRQITMR